MALSDEIEKMRKEIRTDGYPMSIGEWITMYEKGELDIHPEFQRFYRWAPDQKSRFIESILLGIPIPQIFVNQRKDGVWDVVDGLQRLSTIFQFLGILKDAKERQVKPLVLERTKYLPSLEGKKWDDVKDPDNSFSSELKLLIKRSKISASIILRESDEIAKFELFQRLNTGGSNLTPQEVRNCILVMTNDKMYRWLRRLASYEPFSDCINLSETPLMEQYDMELVLRFVAFSDIDLPALIGMGDVGVFLTERMIVMARDKKFNFVQHERKFKKTFDFLSSNVGANAFRKYSWERKRYIGGFVISPFEVIAFGLGYNQGQVPASDKIDGLVKNLWKNTVFKQWSGSGLTATRRLPKLIPLGRQLFHR